MKIELHYDSYCSNSIILFQKVEQRNECLTLSWAKNSTNFRFMNKIFYCAKGQTSDSFPPKLLL